MSEEFPALTPLTQPSTELENSLAGYLPLDGTEAMQGNLDLGDHNLILAPPPAAGGDPGEIGGTNNAAAVSYSVFMRTQRRDAAAGSLRTELTMDDWKSGVSSADKTILLVADDASSTYALSLTASNRLFFGFDSDTYWTRLAADQHSWTAGGVEMLRLVEDTTDYAAFGPIGTATVPAVTWITDLDTGVSASVGDRLDLIAGGINMLALIESTDDQVAVGPAGSTTVPSLTWISDLDTGFANETANRINVILGGTNSFRFIGGSFLTFTTGAFRLQDSTSAATPTYSFLGDEDSGVYRSAANAVSVATAGLQRAVFDASGNFGLGTTTFGTSATRTLALFNGTVPSTSPADTVQLFSVDISAGNASLGIRTETAVQSAATVSDRYLNIKINGTTYKLLLST